MRGHIRFSPRSAYRLMRFLSSKTPRSPFYFLLAACCLVFWVWVATSATQVRLPNAEGATEFYCRQCRDDVRATLIQAIGRAQKSVQLIIFSLTDRQVIEALNERARAGVPVRVIFDRKHNPKLKRQMDSSVQLVGQTPEGLMHRKILVIDEAEVWVGSANFTGESLALHDNLLLSLSSPPLARWIASHYDDPPNSEGSCSGQVGGQEIEFWLLPEEESALNRLTGMIQSAQKSVRVAMFTFTHPALVNALTEAHQRGLDVQVIVDRSSGHGVSGWAIERLSHKGVPTALSQGPGLCHHKLLILDETILVTGSANWTRSAFDKNQDCIVVLRSLTPPQQDLLARLWRELVIDVDWSYHEDSTAGIRQNGTGG